MLRTSCTIPLTAKRGVSSAAASLALVSSAPPRCSKPEMSDLDELETELAGVRRALAAARVEILSIQSAEKSARFLALHDGLTALPNLRFFRLRLEQALAHESRSRRSLAVLYLDLDGFKQLNDIHGHHIGDELMQHADAAMCRAKRQRTGYEFYSPQNAA